MKLWDDPRIIETASMSAIELYAHAINGVKLDKNTGMTLFENIAKVLARCFVLCAEARIMKQIKSKEVIDDPNM